MKDLLEEMLKRRVDGLLIINPREDNRYQQLHPLVENNIPIVFIKDKSGNMPVSSVTCNGIKGGYEATKYLIELGHTSIAIITGRLNEADAKDRLTGYHQALAEAGIERKESLTVNGKWTEASGQQAATQLLKRGESFTAIFAQNDRMAMGAIHALNVAGLKVPQDISIIGFDNAPIAGYLVPPITTMYQPIDKLGQQAVLLLSKAIQDPDFSPQDVHFNPQLIERESCMPLNPKKEVK